MGFEVFFSGNNPTNLSARCLYSYGGEELIISEKVNY